jgi:putative tricarboxylic transport membrane protein
MSPAADSRRRRRSEIEQVQQEEYEMGKRSCGIFAGCLLGAALQAAFVSPGVAQTRPWKPEKSVELVVPAGPGGGTDLATRVIQKIITEKRLVESPTVVVNKPGAAGGVAYTYIVQHKAEPHFLVVTYPSLVTNYIVGTSTLKHSDLTALANLSNSYIGFSVRADSALKSGKDLIDRLQKDPTSVAFGTFALGAGTHLAVAMVAKAAGVDPKKLKVVIFPSGAASQTALLGGHVDVVPTALSNLVGPVGDGRLRILAVTSPKRMEAGFPKVPTWKETGINVVIGQWRGVMGAPGISPAQIAYWEDIFGRLAKTDEWKAELVRNLDENEYMGSRDAARFLDKDFDETKRILTELGLAKQN